MLELYKTALVKVRTFIFLRRGGEIFLSLLFLLALALPMVSSTDFGYDTEYSPYGYNIPTDVSSTSGAGTGDCPAGQVVQNTTTGGVQCVPMGAGSGDGSYNITYDATSKDVTANRSSWISTYNSTYHTWLSNYTQYSKYWYNMTIGGGNPFNQVLNTTSNVMFNSSLISAREIIGTKGAVQIGNVFSGSNMLNNAGIKLNATYSTGIGSPGGFAVSMGINAPDLGNRVTTKQGSTIYLDSRGGYGLMTLYRYTGTAVETIPWSISDTGTMNVGIGHLQNAQNAWLYIKGNGNTYPSLRIDQTGTADLIQVYNLADVKSFSLDYNNTMTFDSSVTPYDDWSWAEEGDGSGYDYDTEIYYKFTPYMSGYYGETKDGGYVYIEYGGDVDIHLLGVAESWVIQRSLDYGETYPDYRIATTDFTDDTTGWTTGTPTLTPTGTLSQVTKLNYDDGTTRWGLYSENVSTVIKGGGLTIEDGNLYVSGSITNDGGSDPPYELFFNETRASVLAKVRKNVPLSRANGMVHYYNSELSRWEDFKPLNCHLYKTNITSEWRELIDSGLDVRKEGDKALCYNQISKTKTYWDSTTNTYKTYQVPVTTKYPKPTP